MDLCFPLFLEVLWSVVIIYFEVQIVSGVLSGQAPLSWCLHPFDMTPSFLECVLTVNTISFSWLVFRFSLPSPGKSHFFLESWFILVKTWFRSQGLAPRCAHCYLGGLLKPSQWLQLGCCVCVCVHIYMHIYTIFLCYWKTEFTLTQF